MTNLEELAATILTQEEYEALNLHTNGWGYRRIAGHQDIAFTTARDRVKRARQKLELATRKAKP